MPARKRRANRSVKRQKDNPPPSWKSSVANNAIPVISLVISLLSLMIAMFTPEIRGWLELSPTPSFEGTVGQLEDASDFVEFMRENERTIVYLNVRIPGEEFEGAVEGQDPKTDLLLKRPGNIAYFALYEQCPEELAPNEHPDNVGKRCTGVEYQVRKVEEVTDSGFGYLRGDYVLRGYFANPGLGSNHQRLRGGLLTPMNIADVPSQ